MSAGFRELDGVTADVGIEAWGQTLEEAFSHAGNALASLMSDRGALAGDLLLDISVTADDRASLLVTFLNEIIFLEETEDFLPLEVASLDIDGNRLCSTISGSSYDASVHRRNMEVKAATYHGLRIEENKTGFRVRVIFDV
ncbi:MAG: archease [bacterium]|nr:MAG: archease [bacterium]